MDDDDRFIREPECKRRTGLSRTTRWRLEKQGKFPKSVQLSESAKGWRLSKILQWMRDRDAENIGAADAA